jgi:hypothetical protein
MDYLKIEPDKSVLVLNSSYEPINITNWKRAVVLLLKQKAQAISKRVIRLLTYVKIPLSQIVTHRPSKGMIYKRDKHKCQYCGSTKDPTIDHIIPKSRGGQDTWENLVVACSTCNTKKGDLLLEQTGMKLAKSPKAHYNRIQIALSDFKVTEWVEYTF